MGTRGPPGQATSVIAASSLCRVGVAPGASVSDEESTIFLGSLSFLRPSRIFPDSKSCFLQLFSARWPRGFILPGASSLYLIMCGLRSSDQNQPRGESKNVVSLLTD